MVICLDMLCASDRAQAAHETRGKTPPKTNGSHWFPHDGMMFLSPQCTSARCHPHSPLLFLPVSPSLATCFPFHIVCSQVLMPATFRQSPEVLSPDSALTKENVRLLLSLSFSGLLNKRLLVWLFLDSTLGIDVGGFASEEQPTDATNQCAGAWLSCTTDRKFQRYAVEGCLSPILILKSRQEQQTHRSCGQRGR